MRICAKVLIIDAFKHFINICKDLNFYLKINKKIETKRRIRAALNVIAQQPKSPFRRSLPFYIFSLFHPT